MKDSRGFAGDRGTCTGARDWIVRGNMQEYQGTGYVSVCTRVYVPICAYICIRACV